MSFDPVVRVLSRCRPQLSIDRADAQFSRTSVQIGLQVSQQGDVHDNLCKKLF